ncbi:MAG TPA: hypothetical protein PKV66_06820 [Candidatus Pelethenecus sp.]|nr:hypothetical protein [Candidatus Pelethenecus sp.]
MIEKRLNTSRKMSYDNIFKSFETMIKNYDSDGLYDFVQKYPTFTSVYIEGLTSRIELINKINEFVRKNEQK